MIVSFFERHRIYYGWVILAVAFFTLFIVLGFRFSFGVFYVAILDETGWSRAETAGIFSTAMIVYAIFCLAAGWLFDSLGPRVLFPLGVVVFSIGIVLSSTIQEIWQLYLYYGVLVGIGFSMLGFPPHMAYIPRWFLRRRGLAASLALSGIGVGSLVISMVSERAIEQVGWRNVFLAFGVGSFILLIPPIVLFYRNSPQSIGLNVDGMPLQATGQHLEEGPTLFQAFHDIRYWVLFLGVTMIGLGGMTLVVHQTRMLFDLGTPLLVAASMFGVTGFLRSAGGMIWGPVSDHLGSVTTLFLIGGVTILGLILLLLFPVSPPRWVLWGFVFMWGLGLPAVAPVYATIVANNFHGRHLGKIMGTLDQGYGIGAAIGPFVAGWIFDQVGNYQMMHWLLICVTVLMVCALAYGSRPARVT